jgi:hypothetical protein
LTARDAFVSQGQLEPANLQRFTIATPLNW